MDFSLIVKRTHSITEIEKVIYHPDVIKLSTENGVKGSIDTESDCWVGTYVDNEIVGVFVFEPLNIVTLDTHCYFLPKHRKAVSAESYKKSVSWIFDNSEYKKLIVKCSQRDWHVKNFCLSNGFKLEGRIEKSTISKGKLVDEYLLGITKGQFLRCIDV